MKNNEKNLDGKISKETLKWFLNRLTLIRFQLVFAILVLICLMAIEGALPWVLGQSIQWMAESRETSKASQYLLLFFVLLLLRFGLSYSQGNHLQKLGQWMGKYFRDEIFSHMLRLPMSEFDKEPAGKFLTRVLSDVRTFTEVFTASVSTVFIQLATMTSAVIAMLVLNRELSFWVLMPIPFLTWGIIFLSNKMAMCFRETRRLNSEMNILVSESLWGVSTIQMLNAEKNQQFVFDSAVDAHLEGSRQTIKVLGYTQPLSNILHGVSTLFLVVWGGRGVIEGKFDLALIIAFLGYVRNIYQPVRDIVEKYHTALSSLVSAERIRNSLVKPVEHYDPYSLQIDPVASSVQGEVAIRFEGVTFSYPESKSHQLKNVNFEILPKEWVAITGATGSGKTTITRLIMGFYPSYEGKIFVYGTDIRNIPLQSLRRTFGYITQELFLFQGTIRENLVLGLGERPDFELEQICRATDLWMRIEARGGLSFVVDEGARNLSLGERQLVVLSRILVWNPPIIVFDEATASLDTLLEATVMAALEKVLEGRTVLLVAHRMSTIQKCTKILKVEKGLVEVCP